ncbi:hypothetical protein BESB_015760 [Besnoitia besnoiti]|uniref:Endonuclease/exonuclease/phosphatase domain-containing protein n=1 Tax=Besnoitia besnoiti TaxID=94643 RepID=A0A2A9M130_BESBE|nr:hypothetical protein BESB_015760 [Besnoitia besnoiti]PFH32258.1 hypothetical protein BESB_015760 [Besnoitia besnoiti]
MVACHFSSLPHSPLVPSFASTLVAPQRRRLALRPSSLSLSASPLPRWSPEGGSRAPCSPAASRKARSSVFFPLSCFSFSYAAESPASSVLSSVSRPRAVSRSPSVCGADSAPASLAAVAPGSSPASLSASAASSLSSSAVASARLSAPCLAVTFASRAQGDAGSAASASVRVLTYNILHRLDARRARFFAYCQPAHLQSERRLAAVGGELQSLLPDVACLQEVERESLSFLIRRLSDDGYACAVSLFTEKGSLGDGCALLYRATELELIDTHTFRFSALVDDFFPYQKTTRDQMTLAFWRRVKEKRNMAVVAGFRIKKTDQVVYVCSTHLFWDPRQPDVKLLQAFLLLGGLRRYVEAQEARRAERSHAEPSADAETTEDRQKRNTGDSEAVRAANQAKAEDWRNATSPGVPLIIGGDFNSMPSQTVTRGDRNAQDGGGAERKEARRCSSGVYQLMTTGLVLPSHLEHPVSFHSTLATGAVPALVLRPLRSAYKEVLGAEPRFTNYTRDFQGCLDYLFFENAVAKAVLSVPEESELKREVALPNSRFPSDHVALMADFALPP